MIKIIVVYKFVIRTVITISQRNNVAIKYIHPNTTYKNIADFTVSVKNVIINSDPNDRSPDQTVKFFGC